MVPSTVLDRTKKLLRTGADVNWRPPYVKSPTAKHKNVTDLQKSMTCFAMAVEKNACPELVQILVQSSTHPVQIDTKDVFGLTPLM